MSRGKDYTSGIIKWLASEHDLVKPVAYLPYMAGLLWGLALAARHPEYAKKAHEALTSNYHQRTAGGKIEFQAMAVASGDERTSPEKLADQLVEDVEIHA